jgi:hypothetical protein
VQCCHLCAASYQHTNDKGAIDQARVFPTKAPLTVFQKTSASPSPHLSINPPIRCKGGCYVLCTLQPFGCCGTPRCPSRADLWSIGISRHLRLRIVHSNRGILFCLRTQALLVFLSCSMSVMMLNSLNSKVLSPGFFPAAVVCIHETVLSYLAALL